MHGDTFPDIFRCEACGSPEPERVKVVGDLALCEPCADRIEQVIPGFAAYVEHVEGRAA
jgi:hypothetical protein